MFMENVGNVLGSDMVQVLEYLKQAFCVQHDYFHISY